MKTILVVDDEPKIVQLVGITWNGPAFVCALELIRNDSFALLIVTNGLRFSRYQHGKTPRILGSVPSQAEYPLHV